MSRLYLGKNDPKFHCNTLSFKKYQTLAPPPAPSEVHWGSKIGSKAWTMMGNSTAGDCTCAEIGHMVMCWTSLTGTMVVPTTQDVFKVYSAVTGYDPSKTDADGNNPTDNGAAITDVLSYWSRVGIAGHKIDGWAQIDQTNLEEVKQAIYLFGGIDLGVVLHQSDMDRFDKGQTWDVSQGWLQRVFKRPKDPVLGGHSVYACGYSLNPFDIITWGQNQLATPSWFANRCDEAYAIISLDFIGKNSEAPNHINLDLLKADLAALKAN